MLCRSRDHRGSRNCDTFQLPLMKWTEAPSNHLFPARFDSILKGSMELITFGFVETRTIFTMGAFSRRPVNGEIKVAWNDIGENSRYSCRCINEISWTIFLFSHSRRIPVEPDSLKRQKERFISDTNWTS